jgi:hypothetical protein
MKLPVRIYVDLRQRIEDTMLHTLDFSVIGSEASTTVAVVESNFYAQPKIVSIEQNGLSLLDADLRERFLLKLFRLAVHEMRKADGDAITRDISDLTKWIGKQFSASEAAVLEHVLDSFERPDLEVQDRAEIRID